MELGEPDRKEPAESVIPMINVVFLLLVFFLMSATLAPPDPLEATPPEAAIEEGPAEAFSTLVLGPDGALAFRERRGDEAVQAAAAAHLAEREALGADAPDRFQLRADTKAPAKAMARVVAQLAQAGVGQVAIVTVAASE